MIRLILICLLWSTSLYAQTANDNIASTIGKLIIQNANLDEKVKALTEQNEKLVKELAEEKVKNSKKEEPK